MDLIDEQDGRPFGYAEHRTAVCPRLVKDFPDFLDTGAYRRQGIELTVQCRCDDTGQRRLPDAGRAPEDKGRQVPALKHIPKDRTLSDEVLLPDVFVQVPGPHPLRKGREDPGLPNLSHFLYLSANYLNKSKFNKSVNIGNIFVYALIQPFKEVFGIRGGAW